MGDDVFTGSILGYISQTTQMYRHLSFCIYAADADFQQSNLPLREWCCAWADVWLSQCYAYWKWDCLLPHLISVAQGTNSNSGSSVRETRTVSPVRDKVCVRSKLKWQYLGYKYWGIAVFRKGSLAVYYISQDTIRLKRLTRNTSRVQYLVAKLTKMVLPIYMHGRRQCDCDFMCWDDTTTDTGQAHSLPHCVIGIACRTRSISTVASLKAKLHHTTPNHTYLVHRQGGIRCR